MEDQGSNYDDKTFGELLTLGIKSRARINNENVGEIQKKYAKEIGVSIPGIRNWCKVHGNIPNHENAVRAISCIVRDCAKKGGMDYQWARHVLQRVRDRFPREKARDLFIELDFICKSLEWDRFAKKMKNVQRLENCPIALVGSVYYDQIIGPLDEIFGPDELQFPSGGVEVVGLSPIRFDLGGSGLWVGRYLYLLFGGIKSYLFSVVGKGQDSFTRDFREGFHNEIVKEDDSNTIENQFNGFIQGRPRWCYDRTRAVGDFDDSRTAVTIRMLRSEDKPELMITHRGVLSHLDWTLVENQGLSELLIEGGLLYISGYMRSSLYKQLTASLRRYSENAIVCIDHGGLEPTQANPLTIKPLLNAFRDGLIDVYLASYRELWSIAHFGQNVEFQEAANDSDVEKELQEIVETAKLPLITIVRDRTLPNIKTYLILDQFVFPIRVGTNSLGSNNAFNAAIIHGLSDDKSSRDNIYETIDIIIKEASVAWYGAARSDVTSFFPFY